MIILDLLPYLSSDSKFEWTWRVLIFTITGNLEPSNQGCGMRSSENG
jgi:hypothetical protein